MKLYKTNQGIIIELSEKFYLSNAENWDDYINQENLFDIITADIQSLSEISWNKEGILAPIQNQEIWASGVTYMRSREARMDESKDSGGADFYAKVYEAERPELFFKSTAARCVGTGEKVRIRKDSKWNVPEPELTLFINSSGKIVGYTIVLPRPGAPQGQIRSRPRIPRRIPVARRATAAPRRRSLLAAKRARAVAACQRRIT